jgi:hypothetical protein
MYIDKILNKYNITDHIVVSDDNINNTNYYNTNVVITSNDINKICDICKNNNSISIVKVPNKLFEFNRLIKRLNIDRYDIYNNHQQKEHYIVIMK